MWWIDSLAGSSGWTGFWAAGIAAALLLSTAVGFVAGVMYARGAPRRQLAALQAAPLKIVQHMLQMFDTLQDLCGLLDRAAAHALPADTLGRLADRQQQLLDTLRRIAQRQSVSAQRVAVAPAAPSLTIPVEPVKVAWTMAPADCGTQLPDRSAFDANLALLLSVDQGPRVPSGVLLIRVDRSKALRTRFGGALTEQLLRKLGAVICRCVRDVDFVGQVDSELFGVLMPGVDFETGARQAGGIRDAIRNYRFRLDDNGPEVLLTASFGFTACLPGEHLELVFDRAADGLEKSQRLGRNQLHVHDGGRLLHSVSR